MAAGLCGRNGPPAAKWRPARRSVRLAGTNDRPGLATCAELVPRLTPRTPLTGYAIGARYRLRAVLSKAS